MSSRTAFCAFMLLSTCVPSIQGLVGSVEARKKDEGSVQSQVEKVISNAGALFGMASLPKMVEHGSNFFNALSGAAGGANASSPYPSSSSSPSGPTVRNFSGFPELMGPDIRAPGGAASKPQQVSSDDRLMGPDIRMPDQAKNKVVSSPSPLGDASRTAGKKSSSRSISSAHLDHVGGAVRNNVSSEEKMKMEKNAPRCDNTALDVARHLVQLRKFEGLKDHPCVAPEGLDALTNGTEDPKDVMEFLGTTVRQDARMGCFINKLPTVLYIGMGHSGSTSLANQMNMHPELSYGKMKEHHFFASLYRRGGGSWQQYEQEFHVPCGVKHTFDATPTYMKLGDSNHNESADGSPLYAPGVDALETLRKKMPGVKLIAMFRDPLKFHLSQQVSELNEHEYLNKVPCYAKDLERWLKVFPREDFLFLRSEDYFQQPQKTLDEVFKFLGVSPRTYRARELAAAGRRRTTPSPMASRANFQKLYYRKTRFSYCKKWLHNLTGLAYDWAAKMD